MEIDYLTFKSFSTAGSYVIEFETPVYDRTGFLATDSDFHTLEGSDKESSPDFPEDVFHVKQYPKSPLVLTFMFVAWLMVKVNRYCKVPAVIAVSIATVLTLKEAVNCSQHIS